MARIVITDSESLENSLKEKNMARNMKNAFLFVAVLLGGFIEELDENRMVKELSADDKAFHFFADVNRDVTLRHRTGGAENSRTAELGGGGGRVGAE